MFQVSRFSVIGLVEKDVIVIKNAIVTVVSICIGNHTHLSAIRASNSQVIARGKAKCNLTVTCIIILKLHKNVCDCLLIA